MEPDQIMSGVMDGKMFDISSYIVHSNPETGVTTIGHFN